MPFVAAAGDLLPELYGKGAHDLPELEKEVRSGHCESLFYADLEDVEEIIVRNFYLWLERIEALGNVLVYFSSQIFKHVLQKGKFLN